MHVKSVTQGRYFPVTDSIIGAARTTYNIQDETAEGFVSLDFADSDTYVAVTVKRNEDQSIARDFLISQKIGERDRLTPKITADRKLELEWFHTIDDDQSVTTTVSPNERVVVKWKDGPWTAIIYVPYRGIQVEGMTVRINRKISL